MVDQNALRTNQIFIVATVAFAFLLGSERGAWLIALLAVCMAIGVLSPGNGPDSAPLSEGVCSVRSRETQP